MNFQKSDYIFHDNDIDFYDGQQHPLYIVREEATLTGYTSLDRDNYDFNTVKRGPLIEETLLVYPVTECPKVVDGQCQVLDVIFKDVVSMEYRAIDSMLVIKRVIQ